jgi:hypothetical protein
MILPDFVLPSRINQCWEYSGMDSPTNCLDKTHFKQYPHAISYHYNSRGFRDQEWPESSEDLKTAIWCVGDSFTVGLGSPVEHTWPWLLQKQTGQRIINVSMDGASNNWIARQVKQIQDTVAPKTIVIMWSYLHRRESSNNLTSDEERRLHSDIFSDDATDIDNFKRCVELVDYSNTNILEFSVPHYTAIGIENVAHAWSTFRGHSWPLEHPTTPQQLLELPEFVQHELKQQFNVWEQFQQVLEINYQLSTLIDRIVNVERLDLARDGHHFDRITAQWVVDRIVNQLTR